MKIEFDIVNREFFRTLTFSLKFQKKAQVSIIYMKNIVFLLPSYTAGTQSVLQQEYYTQFHSSGQNVLAIGTADQAITYIRSVELNGNQGKNLKEIPLLINFVSLIIVHYSYRFSLAAPDTCSTIICFPDLKLKSLAIF